MLGLEHLTVQEDIDLLPEGSELLTNPGPVEAYQRSLRWYADDLYR